MGYQIQFKVNSSIYLKDPDSSEVGKQIVKKAIDLIYELGFEHFTFKKLAIEIGTTEATVYRYFENKHRLLLYIINWYWSYMEFLLLFSLQKTATKRSRIKLVVDLITHQLPEFGSMEYNTNALSQIAITESSKVYLIKEVSEINKSEVFKPYKDLCSQISSILHEYNPAYKYPNSLSSTIIETAHQQAFFSENLPRLTDVNPKTRSNYANIFLYDLLVKVLE